MKFWDERSVFQKLMIILLSSTLVLVGAMLILARWSYEQGFFDYTNALEQTRLQRLEPKLIALYEEYDLDIYALPNEKVADIITRFPGRPVNSKGPLPPNRARILPGQRAKPPTALFDLNGNFLAGAQQLINPNRQFVTVDVHYRGEVIARLASIPSRHFNSPLETQVSKTQWERSILVGVLSIGAAVLLSFIVSLIILKPIRRIINAIGSISKGNYNVRLKESSKDELGSLMRDVDYLAYTLHSTQWSRKQWLANISHDMRTPLTVLTGEIQAIKDGIREFDLERLRSIEQEVNHLRKFTEDIYELSLSDIGGLRYEFKPVDLYEIVSNCVDSLRLKAEKNGLTLTLVGKPVIISGDHSRLLQLCKNIICNSIDYTESPGLIEVSVYWNEEKAVLCVSDSPPSVSKGSCRHLFDPLYREDSSRSRVKKGGGLGLAICKNIVDAHKGTITAQRSQYDGLKIIAELPKTD
ncbi:ATP-binding protein [Marinomonas balearica]|uniref:histidine kinase n=1 Tax=Marinomonas balearica TaxID=491947 RepID=A0A4R6M9F5_9GAMM|nr:ATP-binding protein [Marinomonas balearica]TDO98044.1 two-component system sensor histidine kinase BaeS [Marinomonas balearica]